MVVMAGVEASHMPVSQIKAMSAVSSARQALATGFLLALQQDGDLAGQAAMGGTEGAAGLDKGHQLALVVGGAAAKQVFRAVLAGDHARLERIAVPQLQRIDRLHVVMAVEQQVRAVSGQIVSHHHRVSFGRRHTGVEADPGQVFGQPSGRCLALAIEGGIGRDRLEAQQGEQPLQRLAAVIIEVGENRGQIGHAGESFRINAGSVRL
jgi:hypothetical protein